MTPKKLNTLLFVSAIGLVASGIAHADCEADLNRLEQAFKSPNLSATAKAALEEAKTNSVKALRKDDDAGCHAAVMKGLEGAGLVQAAPAASPTANAPVESLGDLSSYRVITQDTLRIVKTGDLAPAKTRIKDLETAWDVAAPKLRSVDGGAWTRVDDAIDAALKQLRASKPDAKGSADALQALIAILDGAK